MKSTDAAPIDAALREFTEETGVTAAQLHTHTDAPPRVACGDETRYFIYTVEAWLPADDAQAAWASRAATEQAAITDQSWFSLASVPQQHCRREDFKLLHAALRSC